jgi:hypothetical protein
VLKLNDTGEGASYRDSGVVKLYRTFGPDVEQVILAPSADVIAGILLYWVRLVLLHGEEGFADCGSRLRMAFQMLKQMIGLSSVRMVEHSHLRYVVT